MITAVVIDDHPIVRAGMRAVLDAAPDVTVVAEGASGHDALRLVEEQRPDVLVLDVNLPGLNGLDVTRRLCAQAPRPPAILILTVHDDAQTIMGLLESGATGYVLKDEALETLVGAVRAAARGKSWLSPAVANQVVRRAERPRPPPPRRTRRSAPHPARARRPVPPSPGPRQRCHRPPVGGHQAHRAESRQQHLCQAGGYVPHRGRTAGHPPGMGAAARGGHPTVSAEASPAEMRRRPFSLPWLFALLALAVPALVLYTLYYQSRMPMLGLYRDSTQEPSVVTGVMPGSPAAAAGLPATPS